MQIMLVRRETRVRWRSSSPRDGFCRPRALFPMNTQAAMSRPQNKKHTRRGASTVELAFVLPVFLIFMFGIFVIGHAQMVNNTMRAACRAAARYGATEGVTTADVENFLEERLAVVVDPDDVNMVIKDASDYDGSGAGEWPTSNSDFGSMPNIELDDAEPRQLFVVRASIDYADISILQLPWLSSMQLSGQAFMRHE